MSRLTQSMVKLLCLTLVVAVVGCQEPTEGMTEDEQAAQSAAERIKELEDLYDQAHQAQIAAEDEALTLRTERDRLKADLANLRASGPAAGWDSIPGGAMTSIEGTVLFASGKAVLKSGAKNKLAEAARVIVEKFGDHEIYVFGHTDAEPISKSGWKDNYELSCQRALSVVRYFQGQGVTQYMAACGWGDRRPVAKNPPSGRQQANRRVEIFALARPQPVTGSVSAARP